MATRVVGEEEINGEGSKSGGDGNEEGDGKSGKSDGNGDEEGIDNSGKSDGDGDEEGKGKGGKGKGNGDKSVGQGMAMVTKRAMATATRVGGNKKSAGG